MIEARYGHTATLLLDGTVLVAGGYRGGGTFDPLASADLYDPIRGTWSAAAGMIEPRSGHTATLLLNGQVLVVGGGSGLGSAELYDPSGGT
jgi:hypothetical protein